MLSKNSVILFFVMLLSVMTTIVVLDNNQSIVVEETPVIVKEVNAKHLQCLATAIYYEAAKEPFMGQVAVARVVMNRVKRGFASDPCRVVYQKTVKTDDQDNEITLCQFSWVCEGLTAPAKSNKRYQQAIAIAKDVLAEDRWSDVIPSNVLFFHNLTVNPRWIYKRAMTIGNHVFYSH